MNSDETTPLTSRADARGSTTRWRVPALVGTGWLLLWYFTPGLHHFGLGSLLAVGDTAQILIETIVAAGVLALLMARHPRYQRSLFARSKLAYLYGVPLVLAVLLPFHYELSLPVAVYIGWMCVSVLWQDYLTFGLLQSYLADHLPNRIVVPLVALVFYLGHAVYIPEMFAPVHVIPALGILALGAAFALLRARMATLHLLLALHLSFYFVFA